MEEIAIRKVTPQQEKREIKTTEHTRPLNGPDRWVVACPFEGSEYQLNGHIYYWTKLKDGNIVAKATGDTVKNAAGEVCRKIETK